MPTPLPGADDVGDDGLAEHEEAAGAQALDGPEGDELEHRCRQAGQHAADQEQHDRALEELLATVEVAELAVERRRDRGGQEVGRHHPGDVVDAAEVTDDRRYGGGHDRGVDERGQHHAEQEPREDDDDLAVGEAGGVALGAPGVAGGTGLRFGVGDRHAVPCRGGGGRWPSARWSKAASTARRNAALPPSPTRGARGAGRP